MGLKLKLKYESRDKTRLLLLLPLNYIGSPGSSLSVVHLCLVFLIQTSCEGSLDPYPIMDGDNCLSIL